MGRPVKNPDEKKKKRVPISFSNIDIMRIKEQANKEHLPVSVWIRQKILALLNGKGQP
jgi:predicted DNA binding CopG/RHH family protein